MFILVFSSQVQASQLYNFPPFYYNFYIFLFSHFHIHILCTWRLPIFVTFVTFMACAIFCPFGLFGVCHFLSVWTFWRLPLLYVYINIIIYTKARLDHFWRLPLFYYMYIIIYKGPFGPFLAFATFLLYKYNYIQIYGIFI